MSSNSYPHRRVSGLELQVRRARVGSSFAESDSRFIFLFEHDLFRKPLHTFRDHALSDTSMRSSWSRRGVSPAGRLFARPVTAGQNALHPAGELDLKNIQDGGEAILEALRSLKVEYVISSPGSEWPSLWEALARQKASGVAGPTYLDCGHETLAVSMATGYTQVTGRMQAVLLHAGAGLLQGSMAIYGARAMAAPMLVMSGESSGYGEGRFDPGPQWYRNLNVVGGPQRLVEPVVKLALQSTSVDTLYHGVVRAGELAQRTPCGPTYLCVSMEAMIEEWSKPESLRAVPPAPPVRPDAADIADVAARLAEARSPFILAESAGSDQATFDALVELAELLAIPVLDAPGACLANFPKSHGLYLGLDANPYLAEMDFALLVENE